MKSFREYHRLNEKLIMFNHGARYGQIVIMGGGIGSGKSYVAKNFVETDKFKIIDIDAWKAAFIKLKKYPEWESFSFKDPSAVSRLQVWIMRTKIRDKVLDLLFDKSRNKEVLPNILFDLSLGTTKQLSQIVDLAIDTGYKPESIHLVYVLTDWENSLNRNRSRDRTLGDGVVLKTALDAAKSVTAIVHQLPTGFNGAIKLVLTNQQELDYLTVKDEGGQIDSSWKQKLKELIDKNLGGMPPELPKEPK